MMTALRITQNRRPTDYRAGIQPMSAEDARFWQLLRRRKPEIYERGKG